MIYTNNVKILKNGNIRENKWQFEKKYNKDSN